MDILLPHFQCTIHTAARGRLTSAWRATDPRQPFARLYFILAGQGMIRHHNHEYPLVPGELYIIPARTPLTYRCDEALDICWTHFNAEVLSGLDLFDYLACDYQVTAPARDLAEQLFARLMAIHLTRTPAARIEAAGILQQLLAPVMDTVDTAHQRYRQQQVMRFQPVLAHIEENLGAPLTNRELAARAHLEETYFSTAFRQLLGVGPRRYLHQRRTERAMQLLWQSDRGLDAIADELGYTDASHFSRTFRQLTGMAPGAFRRQRHPRQP